MGSMESSVSESLPSYAPRSEPAAPASRPAPAANKGPSKGMVLGSKAKKGTNILESLAKEGEVGVPACQQLGHAQVGVGAGHS
jgi:hypothetical protein